MKWTTWCVAPLLLVTGASAALALDCIEREFDTEALTLELESVTVDGSELEDTGAYEGFTITVENVSDYNGFTRGVNFVAVEKENDAEWPLSYVERYELE